MAFDKAAIKDKYIAIGGKSFAVAGLSDAAIKKAVLANPRLLKDDWMVSGTSVVRKPPAPAVARVPVGASPPAPPAPPAPPVPPAPPATGQASGGAPANAGPAAPAATGRASGAAPTNAPTSGFNKASIAWTNLYVNGKAKSVEKMTDDEIRSALGPKGDPRNKNALAPGWQVNGSGQVVKVGPGQTVNPNPTSSTGGGGAAANPAGGGNPAGNPAPATGGAAGTAPTPVTPVTPVVPPVAPVAGTPPPPPSWIPPMVGLGGLNADPRTGKIDWSKLIAEAKGVSAVDPQYAQDLSNNIFSAMQAVAVPQSEIQSLTSIDPTTGKTLYQNLFANAERKYGSDKSNAYGSLAARGVQSSGVANTTQANLYSGVQQQKQEYDKNYGNTRITNLLRQMTDQLGAQDTNFAGSYYSAVSRAKERIPGIPDVTATA